MKKEGIRGKKPLLSKKQIEYIRDANRRWNIKSGATRSGKTYLDFMLLPDNIINTTGEGAIVIVGLTKGTVQRNIIEPLQNIYGPGRVSDISSNNTAVIFGKRVHVLGAEKKNMAERLRGLTIEYAYGDEMAAWSQEVFEMLKSRLSLPQSRVDGTCNPKGPNHWLKEFIDENSVPTEESQEPVVYYQKYTLYDNPFLDDAVVADMEKTMKGVYHKRNILGEWALADGLIYESFAEAYSEHLVDLKDIPPLAYVNMGVDFGGNKSKHAMVVTGIPYDYSGIYILASKRLETGIPSSRIAKEYVDFLEKVQRLTGYTIEYTYTDNAEQVINIDMKNELRDRGLNNAIRNCYKGKIIDRIQVTQLASDRGRLFYTKYAETVRDALLEASWNPKESNDPVRLDDGTTDIDSLDAFEYTFSRDIPKLLNGLSMRQ